MHDAVPHPYADGLDEITGRRLPEPEPYGWPVPEPPRWLSAGLDVGPPHWDPQRCDDWDRHRLCGPERPELW